MALGQGEHVEVGPPLGQPLAVAGAGVGDDEHPGAREVGPPAQVEVVAVEVDRRARSRRARGTGRRARACRPTARRRRRARRRAAPGRARRARRLESITPNAVDAEARRAAARPGRSQSTSFGPTMPALERYISSTSSRMATGRAPRRRAGSRRSRVALDQLQHLVGRGAEPGVVADGPHERVGQTLADCRARHPGLAAVTRNEQAQVRVVLPAERSRAPRRTTAPGRAPPSRPRPGARHRAGPSGGGVLDHHGWTRVAAHLPPIRARPPWSRGRRGQPTGPPRIRQCLQ